MEIDETKFNNDAKQIVDLVFETKCFRVDITRDKMNDIERFISELMMARFKGHLRCNELLKSIDNLKQ